MIAWLRAHDRRQLALVAAGTLGATLAVVLVALPAIWYIGSADAGRGKHSVVENDLLELIALDARWEREALQALTDSAPSPAANHAASVATITKRLEGAARDTASPALQRDFPNLARASTEKAQLMARFHMSHSAAAGALREALGMEAEIAGLLRDVWHDAPDRQRLVAADNVVTQLLADAQRYYFAPTAAQRKNLEASTADLRGATAGLPDAFKAPAARLERHVEDLLRNKPQQQLYLDRIRFHNAGPLAATLARELRHELAGTAERHERYRVYLAAYFCALLVALAYLAARLIRRELQSRAAGTVAVAPATAVAEPVLSPPQDNLPRS